MEAINLELAFAVLGFIICGVLITLSDTGKIFLFIIYTGLLTMCIFKYINKDKTEDKKVMSEVKISSNDRCNYLLKFRK